MDNSRLEFTLNHSSNTVNVYYATDSEPNTINTNVAAIAMFDKRSGAITTYQKLPVWAMRKIRMVAKTFTTDTTNSITDVILKDNEYNAEKNGLIPYITLYIPEDKPAYYDVAHFEKGTPFNIDLSEDEKTSIIPICYLFTKENKHPVQKYLVDVETPEGVVHVLKDNRTMIHATNGNLITIERINRNNVIMHMAAPNKDVWFSRTHDAVKRMVKNGHVNL